MRLSLLRSISKRQKEKDPNAVCSVSSFTPRPMLRVGGGKDKGTRFLSFVDAISGFKHLLTQEDLDKAASMCQGLKGHLQSRFIVLSDDRQPPPPPSKKRPFADVGDDSPRIKRNFAGRVPQGSGPGSNIHPSPLASQTIIHQGQHNQQFQHVPQLQQAQVFQTGAHGFTGSGPLSIIHPSALANQTNIHPGQHNQQFQQLQQAQVIQSGAQGQVHTIIHPGQHSQQDQQAQVVQSGAHGQVQTIFSPSAFPPLQQITQASVPLLTQPIKVLVQGDGYQTVGSKSSRRQSQRVPGVDKISQRRQPSRDQSKQTSGLTETDPSLQENDSQSDSSFVDAPDV